MQAGTSLRFLNLIYKNQIQNACWENPKPFLICTVPVQAARSFRTLLNVSILLGRVNAHAI